MTSSAQRTRRRLSAPTNAGRLLRRLGELLPIYLWLLMLVVVPQVLLLVYSFWRSDVGVVTVDWNLENYANVLTSDTYRLLMFRTLYTALGAAGMATLIGFSMAYFASRRLRRYRLIAVLLVIIPLWVSLLIRVFAWKVILGENGVLNSLLMDVGLTEQPLSIFLYTRFAVFLALTYLAIPFVFVASYTALERIPPSLIEASYDSGAGGWKTFRNVIWPIAKQGAAIGFTLAFILVVGDYLTPSLVGGLNGTMIGSVIVSQFGLASNWPLGAAIGVALVVVVAAIVGIVARLARSEGVLDFDAGAGIKPEGWRRPTLLARLRTASSWVLFVAGYLFLYAPLVVTAVFSFNDSRGQSLPLKGLTLRWYGALATDQALLDALRRSLVVALGTVAISLVVGTAFALIFANRRLRAGGLVQSALALPVLLPGVIFGLALAIGLNEVGIPFGVATVMIGHATFVMPVVMLVVLARLKRLDPALVQASMDLGADRPRTFIEVVFPQIRTALIAAALLGFTLSFDEVLVTFFLVGAEPTLPVYIYNQLRFGFTPTINAAFTVIGLVSVLIVVAATRILRKEVGQDGLGIPGA